VELPDKIFGNQLNHYAHKCDVIRLEKIIERGGIYLDIDTICIKSFSDLLDTNHFVIGAQGSYNDLDKVYGLCNAVMLSVPQSKFALKWYNSYKTFRSTGRDENWDEHSVLMPLRLYENIRMKLQLSIIIHSFILCGMISRQYYLIVKLIMENMKR